MCFFIFSLAFICDRGELSEDIALYARKLVYPEWKPINARALATYLYPYIVYISICRRYAIVGVPVNELPLWHGLYTSPYICNPLASALQFGAEWSVLLAHFIAVYISDTAPLSPLDCPALFRQNNLTSCKCRSCSKVVSAALQFPFFFSLCGLTI